MEATWASVHTVCLREGPLLNPPLLFHDVGLRPPDNPGGWIETRLCDYDAGLATIDTVKLVGFKIYIK